MGESAFFLGRGPAARKSSPKPNPGESHHPSPFLTPTLSGPLVLGHLAAGRTESKGELETLRWTFSTIRPPTHSPACPAHLAIQHTPGAPR